MQMSIYPAWLQRTGSLGSLGRETNEALCDDEKVSLCSCFVLLWHTMRIYRCKHHHSSACNSCSTVKHRFISFLSFFCYSHSLILTSSESYIWTWEVSRSWVIQGSYQQVFPQDRDKILGHDLLLLPGAMVFQRQNHWISRHLSIKIQTRKKKRTFRPYYQQLDCSLCMVVHHREWPEMLNQRQFEGKRGY